MQAWFQIKLEERVVPMHSRGHFKGVQQSGGLQPRKVRIVKDYVEAHLHEKISLSTMAGQIRMSPYHFGRLFKQSTGLSPHQYLMEQRILKAKELLADHRLTIAEISQWSGFNSRAHFTTTFRKRVGKTPSEYRLKETEIAKYIPPAVLFLVGETLLRN